MMNNNIKQIKSEIPLNVKLIAVTKGKSANEIIPLIDGNIINFAENRVNEAIDKWTLLKKEYPDLKLHLIGPLQTNKVKEALQIFDVIETIDNFKLAEKIAKYLSPGRKMPFFVQVNIGNEPQKRGAQPEKTKELVSYCRDKLGLNIVGLMAIPPLSEDPNDYFLKLRELANFCNLKELSMGMSDDYGKAIKCGATQIRLGRILFKK